MAQLNEKLVGELSSISSTYEKEFAGQSRATRDVAQIDALIARARDVVREVDQIPLAARGKDLETVREDANRAVTTYENERRAIQFAKDAGPDFDEFAREASMANFVFAKYVRHFAAQSRTTRDLMLLAEMVDDLTQIKDRMETIAGNPPRETFKADINVVTQNLTRYEEEAKAIADAQASGTIDDRANMLAQLANDQFASYRTHFAGQSRATRRPALLVRVIESLEGIEGRMITLQSEGARGDFHTKNMSIVRGQLEAYRRELDEIRKARKATKMIDLMGMLGGSANELFEEYRKNYAGKSRKTADLARLGSICDRLHEIARQMTDMARVESAETNEQNIGVVVDQLATFESEFEQVRQAQPTK